MWLTVSAFRSVPQHSARVSGGLSVELYSAELTVVRCDSSDSAAHSARLKMLGWVGVVYVGGSRSWHG